MILLLAAAAQAAEPVPFVLPAGADPVVWADVAAGVGLQIVPPGSGAWAEIGVGDAGSVLVVHDPSGAKRTVAIQPPTTRSAREDALLLAVSLLRPFSGGEKGWATPPPPPRTWKPVKATLVAPSSTKCVSSCLPSGSFSYFPGSIHMKSFFDGSGP